MFVDNVGRSPLLDFIFVDTVGRNLLRDHNRRDHDGCSYEVGLRPTVSANIGHEGGYDRQGRRK